MLIEKAGIYETRNGLKVIIDTVKENSPYTFSVKGCYIRLTPSGMEKYEHNIWKPNGQFKAVGESPLDIVKTLKV